MKKISILYCSIVCFLGFPVFSEAADPQAKTYFSKKIGSKWVYDSDGKIEDEEIKSITKAGNSYEIVVKKKVRGGEESEYVMKVNDEGIFLISGWQPEVHPPIRLLKLPFVQGDKWETYLGGWLKFSGERAEFGPDQIEVPAGKYQAVRVEVAYPMRVGPPQIAKYWFAPDVGLVKYSRGKHIKILKSFTEGK